MTTIHLQKYQNGWPKLGYQRANPGVAAVTLRCVGHLFRFGASHRQALNDGRCRVIHHDATTMVHFDALWADASGKEAHTVGSCARPLEAGSPTGEAV
eukprot:297373-Chlamydomonas_euryale.AAC.1